MNTERAPLDVLAIGAHPDDVELTVGGTLLLARSHGLTTGIVHCTSGESGTRGTPELRREEARAAAAQLGAEVLEFLDFQDGRIVADLPRKEAMVEVLRRLRPRLVLAPAERDLHPDHEAVGQIVRHASFLAGLARFGEQRPELAALGPWRPERVLQYLSHDSLEPDLVVDVSEFFAAKKQAAQCYASQFHRQDSTERMTYIAGTEFWAWWEGRHRWFGHFIGVPYGEPFRFDGPLATRDPFSLFRGFGKYRNTENP